MNLDSARKHLLGDGSDALIAFMAAQSVDLPEYVDTQCERGKAIDLGWLDASTGNRTDIGVLVSDSCREYLFWQQRAKALPFENMLPYLSRDVFKDKFVCEIGAGMGANLMSLATTGAVLCGVEPVDAYVTLGDIFRTREGLPSIEMRAGGAEALPFGADELDLVLLVSAHQYFDIHVAFQEIARVLKPGGELILIGGTLPSFIQGVGPKVVARKASPKDFVITVINTLGYTALGQRVIPSRSGFSTSRPIYPTQAAMVRWMAAAGFKQLEAPNRIDTETCYYAVLSGD